MDALLNAPVLIVTVLGIAFLVGRLVMALVLDDDHPLNLMFEPGSRSSCGSAGAERWDSLDSGDGGGDGGD